MESEGKGAGTKEAKLGYAPNYTLGFYLSGIIILCSYLLCISIVFFVPSYVRASLGVIGLTSLLSNIIGIPLALLFLLVKRKGVYIPFVIWLLITLGGKAPSDACVFGAVIGRSLGIMLGIGIPLVIGIYLIFKYKSAFIPKEEKT